jgi:20S proteasome alpha/beta subunit
VTLVIAYPASQAVVMASDGQVTGTSSRDTTRKINVLNDHCIWSGAGATATLGQVEEAMASLSDRDLPLSELRNDIRAAVRDAMRQAIEFDYRSSFEKDWSKLDDDHGADFVFAELRDGRPRILSVSSKAQVAWMDRPYCVGNATKYAYSLLRKYEEAHLDAPRAALLSYCVVSVAISVASSGVGPPIDIWRITEGGCARYNYDQKEALARAQGRLRQRELALLRDWPLPELEEREERPHPQASREPKGVPAYAGTP